MRCAQCDVETSSVDRAGLCPSCWASLVVTTDEERLSVGIVVRVTPDLDRRCRAAAKLAGQSFSDWHRRVLAAACK